MTTSIFSISHNQSICWNRIGTATGGVTGALGGGDIKTAAVAGAIVGGIQGTIDGFRGRIREGEGRIWAVDLVGEWDALPLLKALFSSE
jgi:hypothetical protein